MSFIYTIVISLYTWLIRIVSPFNPKARQWVNGRKGWEQKLKEKLPADGRSIWVHCASLGEFEQGRPVIEMLKERHPERRIIITFFSPSGYEVMKDWPVADHICYLPADTPGNVSRFIDIIRPEMVIFIKYEFWNNYITAIHEREIPLYLVSAIFRPGQYFFRWYGGFFRKQLKKFKMIFVQDKCSLDLLLSIGVENVMLTGDTRFDRVAQIAGSARVIGSIERFRGDEKIFLAGSSWQADEEIITEYINENPGRMKWIFAPHEIDPSNLKRLESLLKVRSVRYSDEGADLTGARVMIIDNIGMLSSAYRYAFIAEVGGGFGKGIHNILEPATWGIPVLFGPDHKKFREAVDMIGLGGAFIFKNRMEFYNILDRLLTDSDFYISAAGKAKKYIAENKGVTLKIIGELTRVRY
jgi:3-deoxy-D-manno-octulosonic-acid transferase